MFSRPRDGESSGRTGMMSWLTRSSNSPKLGTDSEPDSTHRTPPAPASRRLTAINEDPSTTSAAGAAVPPRNPMRSNIPAAPTTPPRMSSPRHGTPTRWSARRISRFSEDTTDERLAPPSYEWINNPSEDNIVNPAEDEKLAELRAGRTHQPARRGGWGRLAVLAGVALLIIIGLAVGLGVGLTRKKHNNNGNDSQPTPSSPSPTPSVQSFPLGTYNIPANLTSIQTDCVSNSLTWRCYPFTIGSSTTFAWTITNTSAEYASMKTTQNTSSSGIPANLTISAPLNPFSVTFSDQNLTYISPANNASAARLVFEFTMSKIVYPVTPLSSDGQPTRCFFNSTTFIGTLYMSEATKLGYNSGGNIWPYAVAINQSAAGGANVPDCYNTVSGASVGIPSEPSNDTCMCGYQNY